MSQQQISYKPKSATPTVSPTIASTIHTILQQTPTQQIPQTVQAPRLLPPAAQQQEPKP